jgi:hypothetical protein
MASSDNSQVVAGDRSAQGAGATQGALQVSERLTLDRGLSTHRTGLRLPERMGVESWCRIGNQISLIANASAWWLGDWLIYGQDRFPGRYKHAMAGTSLDYQTLRNYAWVARRFAQPRRRTDLSFQHHAAVAALTDAEQELWLSRAQTFKWSLLTFRRELRAARLLGADGADADLTTLILSVSAERHDSWAAAADLAQQDLLHWAVGIIDQAADTARRPLKSGPRMAAVRASARGERESGARTIARQRPLPSGYAGSARSRSAAGMSR